MSNPIAIITGATSGIGKAAAARFVRGGYDVVVTGRRTGRLSQLKQELNEQFPESRVEPLSFDVRDFSAAEAALESLPESWRNPALLINNAGLARGKDSVLDNLMSDWEEMIDANVKGLLYVSRIVGRWMRAAGKGHIINVGSTAAKDVYPGGNVYCASKHAVDALTRGMRLDLLRDHIKVSAIHPGFVETEFSLVRFRGDAEKAENVYQGFQPLTGADVAETLWFMAGAPAHVNVADLLLLPAAQASAHMVRRDS